MSPWFRMYSEVLDDPKVQRLPAELFKAWVNILCLAAKGDGRVPGVGDIAFALRVSDEQASIYVDEFLRRELLDYENGEAWPHNWDRRQYKSDVSTDRVRRYRKRTETVSETAVETPPEQSITETDSEQKGVEADASVSPNARRTGSRLPENWTLPLEWREWAQTRRPEIDPYLEGEKFANFWWAKSGRDGAKLDWGATWRNWILNAKANVNAQRSNDPVSFTETAARIAAAKAAARA